MNTFKTAVVLATLLGVGYGAHVVLNKPVSRRNENAMGSDEWSEPEIELGNSLSPRPPVDLPPLRPADATTPPALSPMATTDGPPTLAAPPPIEALAAVRSTSSDEPRAPGNVSPGDSDPSLSSGRSPRASELSSDLSYNAAPQPSVTQASVNAAETDLSSVATAELESTAAPTGVFEEIWDSAETKLQAGQFADALFTLSMFYHDPNLTNEQRDRLITRLDQLAGTTIYSTQHALLPPHTAQPGETLEQIAISYAVPAEFLARVNGRSVGQPLNPGEQLKVVRGPFRGELSLSSRQLTVFLGRHYAGRFSVAIGRDFSQPTTILQVTEKTGPRPYVDQRTGQQIPAAALDNPYGSVWLGLSEPGANARASTLGIHAAGAQIDASDTRGCISVSEKDADDLRAILSIGSQIAVME